jgi:23S rRNA maturation mini-RNase III
MEKEEVDFLVGMRKYLIENFDKCKDYHQNKNAIMREIDHAQILHTTIVKLDEILKNYVNFEPK